MKIRGAGVGIRTYVADAPHQAFTDKAETLLVS
jgi:hypothetical protein